MQGTKEVNQKPIFNCEISCDLAKKYGCGESESIIYQRSCNSTNDCENGICIQGQCTDTCVSVCNRTLKAKHVIVLECLSSLEKCNEEYPEFCRS
jgi:hypothetical protein